MDPLSSPCRCCLIRPSERDLRTTYSQRGTGENFADMLMECYEIQLQMVSEDSGVCDLCVARLRDACNFKHQVLNCEKEFHASIASGLVTRDSSVLELKIEVKSDSEDCSNTDSKMPFKIVKTIEEGQYAYTTVPYRWEKQGILFWPKRNAEKLRRCEQSKPEATWTNLNCILVKSNFVSFQQAENEIARLCKRSGDEDDEMQFSKRQKQIEIDLNMEECAVDSPFNNNSQVTDIENSTQKTEENTFQNGPLSQSLDNKLDAILESNKSLQKSQQLLLSQQKSMMYNLSKISAQFNQLSQQSPLVGLTKRNTHMEVINSIEELKNFENSLNDPEREAELRQQYSMLCGVNRGSGFNTAYMLSDLMFSRYLLIQCSWSGGCRGEGTKYCFKSFTNTINFFFEVVHMSDNSFSLSDCHNFFKMVLKNSMKRYHSKKLRASTAKLRLRKDQKEFLASIEAVAEMSQDLQVAVPIQ